MSGVHRMTCRQPRAPSPCKKPSSPASPHLPPGGSSGAGDSTTGGTVGCSISDPFGFIGCQAVFKKSKTQESHTPGCGCPGPCFCSVDHVVCLTLFKRQGGKRKKFWLEGMTLCTCTVSCSVMTLVACRVAAGREDWYGVIKVCLYSSVGIRWVR